MDKSVVIKLIGTTMTQDKYGVWRESHTEREVYAQIGSISMSEFFEAGRNGLNPEYRFTMFFGDYNDESIVEYNGKTYAVYRTYLGRADKIELYCERKGGTNDVVITT
ncbi:MAG: phage head closure protein [Clostridiales bacterium]|nr:phage head closure protein [Clostridiales bacterium]